MEKRVKIDFKNKIIEVEGDDEFINEKINWFYSLINCGMASGVTQETNSSVLTGDLTSVNSRVNEIFGIDEIQLSYVVHIKGDDFRFILQSRKLKGSRAEVQVKIALMFCGVCELLNKEANTKELRQICENYKCLDGNFAANLKRDGYFSIDKGVNSEISLTMPGRDELQDLMKEIVEGNND